MCIVMCIFLFFDIIFSFKIIVMILIVDSYYRTISNSSHVYRNQLKARILRFLSRTLSPVIKWTQPDSITCLALRLFSDPIRTLAERFASQNTKSPPAQVSDEQLKVYSFEYYI